MSSPMTKINASDLKFYPSERLSDTDDGGGLALGTPIKGVANELFNPIASIARINGGFYARLVYAGVQRPDSEPLIGSFLAITQPPADPAVSYLLFKAHQFGESRLQGIKRIESFSTASIESKLTLLSVQPAGSKIVQAYQRPGETLPLVGDVYCLRQDKAGYPKAEQYVQVVKVSSENRQFYNASSQKDFERVVVKLEISQSLTSDFLGADYPSEDYIDNPCKVRETSVVDAGAYYGVAPITAPIAANRQSLQVPSLMQKLVPTNQVETPLLDLSITGGARAFAKASERITLAYFNHHRTGQISAIYTGNAIAQGSLQVAIEGASALTDQAGTLYQGDKAVGLIDYAAGLVQITSTDPIWSLGNVSFIPAGILENASDSTLLPIRLNNRSYNYVFSLPLALAAGSLQVVYRAQGKTYRLSADATGTLKGASPALGSGSLNSKTGTLALSLGELPDVGSGILLTWASTAACFDRSRFAKASHVLPARALMILPLANAADPASIRLSWQHEGEKSAQCDAQGQLTGDWRGRYNAEKNRLEITTDDHFNHPTGALDVSIKYNSGEKIHQAHKAPLRGEDGRIKLNLTGTGETKGAITQGSVKVRFNLLIEDYDPISKGAIHTRLVDPFKTLSDDAQGQLIDESGKVFGDIDYAKRQLSFLPETTVKIPKATYSKNKIGEQVISEGHDGLRKTEQVQDIVKVSFAGYDYIDAGASMPIDESALVDVWFYDQTPSSSTSESVASGGYELDLLPNVSESILPGSLNVDFGGKRFYDAGGRLMTDLNTSTGGALLAGQVNYQAGTLSIKAGITDAAAGYYQGSNWQTGLAMPVINSLMSAIDLLPVTSCAFITPSQPIRVQSLQIRATTPSGQVLSATSDAQGKITGDHMTGSIDYEYGIAQIQFGHWQSPQDASAVKQSPTSAEQQTGGKVWAQTPVLAQSISYNAIAYSYLPVDSTTIKIDTVRLPQDGRVPIFRRGDTILISHSASQTLDTALTGGQVITLSRQNVDRICLKDSTGKAVAATLWQPDLSRGTITLSSNLNLAGLTLPLIATHTIEERNRLLSADIDGTLSLIFPTRHAYPQEGTFVSSVLIGGDLQVRASVPFTQRNWDNVWRNEPNGSQLLNRLNVKNHPIQLTDDGAISERWLIKWVSSSQFELYGETLGFVLKADALNDLAPINPATHVPYFTLPKNAFGNDAPWAAQDVIRFNTWGTLIPFWVLCAVQPSSQAFEGEDGFKMCLFGDTAALETPTKAL